MLKTEHVIEVRYSSGYHIIPLNLESTHKQTEHENEDDTSCHITKLNKFESVSKQ